MVYVCSLTWLRKAISVCVCVCVCACARTRAWVHLSMGFFRQEYWSGLPFPIPEDIPDPGMELTFPCRQILCCWTIGEASFFCCTLCQKIFKLIISICEYLWIIYMLIYYTFLKHVNSLKGWVKMEIGVFWFFFLHSSDFLYPVLAITELDLLRNFFSLFSYSVSTDPHRLYIFPLFKTDNMTHCFRLS